jgi:hypothetical protein
MKRPTKASATADIALMYTPEDVKDPHTGKTVSGHWCKLCKYVVKFNSMIPINTVSLLRLAKLPFKDAFFTGGVSTRRAHIKRFGNVDLHPHLLSRSQESHPLRSLPQTLREEQYP